jgi:hypothetical protein
MIKYEINCNLKSVFEPNNKVQSKRCVTFRAIIQGTQGFENAYIYHVLQQNLININGSNDFWRAIVLNLNYTCNRSQ